MPIYEVTVTYECDQFLKIKAPSPNHIRGILEKHGLLANQVLEIQNGDFGSLIDVDLGSVKEV